MNTRFFWLVMFFCLVFFSQGCSPPSVAEKKVESVVLGQAQYELPAVAFSQKEFFVAADKKLGSLLGDATGLYHFSNDKLQALTFDPIVGVVPWRGQYILAASSKQLMVFDGSLQKLNLSEKLHLKKETILSIAVQDKDTLWIATSAALWRLKNDTFSSFQSIKDIQRVFSYIGASRVVVQDKKGRFQVLRKEKDGSLAFRQLAKDTPHFQSLFPGAGDTLWGLVGKKIYVLENKDEKSRWVEFSLLGKKEQVASIVSVRLDQNSGQVWAISDSFLFIISSRRVLQSARPDSLKSIVSMSVAGSSLWASDGKKLFLFIHQASKEITYSGQVTVFMKENCWRCHQQVGPGRPLDSYELVKENIQSIISQVESGKMPSDKKPLVGGDVNVLKQWVKNQFAK